MQVSINQASVKDWGYYCGFAYLADPGRVEMDFSRITQPWWPAQVPFDPTSITGFTFSVPDCGVTFNYTIDNLRLLPRDQAGDTDAVTIEPNLYWNDYAGTIQPGGPPAVTALNPVGPPAWGCVGYNPLMGNNSITGRVEGTGVTNLSAYRGIAFEISGGATISYGISHCAGRNNGPAAPGASQPVSQGAGASQSARDCQSTAPAPEK